MSLNKKLTSEKLSTSDCKKILAKNGKIYSEDEIISIRDLLYCFAQIDIETHYHLEKKEKNMRSEETESKIKVINPVKRINKGLKRAA